MGGFVYKCEANEIINLNPLKEMCGFIFIGLLVVGGINCFNLCNFICKLTVQSVYDFYDYYYYYLFALFQGLDYGLDIAP